MNPSLSDVFLAGLVLVPAIILLYEWLQLESSDDLPELNTGYDDDR
jgi:hypothetical protein